MVFLSGVSAGASIAHNVAMMAGNAGSELGVEILGVGLVHPFFWGSTSIGSEEARGSMDPASKSGTDRLWAFVCPSNLDNDDPRVNPVAEGGPSLVGLGCRRVLVSVAEKDLLKDRGGCTMRRWVGAGGRVWLRSLRQKVKVMVSICITRIVRMPKI
ncbi:hypothetical protein RJ640_025384 [Escallonia rubra]|uniref:Alpha/beta hydrolase fold-3 domain-containing protein n=1 Tax=Escallonia rubra TaxID=112253 RepID=A0AA88S006_9ASTE|nr:hypothetical protein RJ640_025384 [Escallonia rubra]